MEAAAYIDLSPGTFDRLVEEGKMPRAKKVYSRLIWDRHEIDLAFDVLGCESTEATNSWDDIQ